MWAACNATTSMVNINKPTHWYRLSPDFGCIRRYRFTRAGVVLAPITFLKATLIKQTQAPYHRRPYSNDCTFSSMHRCGSLVKMSPSWRRQKMRQHCNHVSQDVYATKFTYPTQYSDQTLIFVCALCILLRSCINFRSVTMTHGCQNFCAQTFANFLKFTFNLGDSRLHIKIRQHCLSYLAWVLCTINCPLLDFSTQVCIRFLYTSFLQSILLECKKVHHHLWLMWDTKNVIHIAKDILPVLVPIWLHLWSHWHIWIALAGNKVAFAKRGCHVVTPSGTTWLKTIERPNNKYWTANLVRSKFQPCDCVNLLLVGAFRYAPCTLAERTSKSFSASENANLGIVHIFL